MPKIRTEALEEAYSGGVRDGLADTIDELMSFGMNRYTRWVYNAGRADGLRQRGEALKRLASDLVMADETEAALIVSDACAVVLGVNPVRQAMDRGVGCD